MEHLSINLPNPNFDLSSKKVWYSSNRAVDIDELKNIIKNGFKHFDYRVVYINIKHSRISIILISNNLIPDENDDFMNRRIELTIKLAKLKEKKELLVKKEEYDKLKEIDIKIKEVEHEIFTCPKPGDKKRKMIIRTFKHCILIPELKEIFIHCDYKESIIPDCKEENEYGYFKIYAEGHYKLGR